MAKGLVALTPMFYSTLAEVFFVAPPPLGQDLGNAKASLDTPLGSIAECTSRLKAGGGECRLLPGTYSEPTVTVSGVHGTAAKPVVIAAQPGADVLIDGSSALNGHWNSGKDGAWELTLRQNEPEPVQLFLDGEMMTPARWPDALWSDRSVFNWTHWATFDESQPWSPSNYTRGQPMEFYDSGALAKSGIDATGAMFIGNIADMDTFVGKVTAHTVGSNKFTVVFTADRFGPNLSRRGTIYYLEGLPGFVSQPGEWAYDSGSRMVTLMTPDGASPAAKIVRHKTQVYALNITDAPHLTLANLSFFATTVHALGNIGHMRWESLNFRFPSFSKRMLGDNSKPQATVLKAQESTSYFKQITDPETSSFVVFNCSFFGADGMTLDHYGTHSIFMNNLFDSNDFSAAQNDNFQAFGSALLLGSMGSNDVFERNTLSGNGGSAGYYMGSKARASLNRCTRQADNALDGACLQIRSKAAVNAVLQNNWAVETSKGYRLDSGSNDKFVPDEVNNTIQGNVAAFSPGFMLKNDHNSYISNLALFPPSGPQRRWVSPWALRVDTGRFSTENLHSVIELNVADSWTPDPMTGSTDNSRRNVLDKDVGSQIRDPFNLDFRPREGSTVAAASAGPYDLSETAPDGGARYWIPGRQEWRASSPVPPHGSVSAKPDLDLMFLPGLEHQRHAIHLGRGPSSLQRIGTLKDGRNVQAPPMKPLNGTWWWRVDALDEVGQLLARGEEWQFTIDSVGSAIVIV